MNLHDDKNKDAIAAILKQGLETDFWDIICQSIDENIERLEFEMDEDMSDIPAEEYKIKRENLKNEIKHFEYLRDLPKEIIMFLESTEATEKNFDPYSTASDFDNLSGN